MSTVEEEHKGYSIELSESWYGYSYKVFAPDGSRVGSSGFFGEYSLREARARAHKAIESYPRKKKEQEKKERLEQEENEAQAAVKLKPYEEGLAVWLGFFLVWGIGLWLCWGQ